MSFFLAEDSGSKNDKSDKSTASDVKISTRTEAMAALARMTPVVDLGPGHRWFEIRNAEDAVIAGYFSQTALSHFYGLEEEREGGHPRRWFFLTKLNEVEKVFAPVALCVAPEGAIIKDRELVADCHTTGFMNSNPYPEYAADIEALSSAIGIALPPNHMGREIEDAPSPKGL